MGHYDDCRDAAQASMGSRRIQSGSGFTLPTKAETPHLKEIAGRIEKLSYREMKTLASALADEIKVADQEVVDALLTFADRTLTP
jgi:hypothetical protein